ncbi:MAG: MerR family transcriptional regulator [Candidatus Dormibacteraeota bacterium]|uniref:MerR family transcriptional regulator n=1 Tax=Candidatus Amunia macphersoniae TaxID=3127014 RepID=A0A934KP85_9BACT|nr:MerR family transcriptional regulator [Candidatus Dormibacteraeota bacterium]
MNTSAASEVTRRVGISAADAHQAARISYRQCDHWARRGWVRPSVDPGEGRSGRRVYAAADIVRLDLLRHLAEARVNTATAGPVIAQFTVPAGDIRVLWGPLGGDPGLSVVPADAALARVEAGDGWVVYNPAQARVRAQVLMAQVGADDAESAGAGMPAVRLRSVGRSA